jgi:hypothetical protein
VVAPRRLTMSTSKTGLSNVADRVDEGARKGIAHSERPFAMEPW